MRISGSPRPSTLSHSTSLLLMQMVNLFQTRVGSLSSLPLGADIARAWPQLGASLTESTWTNSMWVLSTAHLKVESLCAQRWKCAVTPLFYSSPVRTRKLKAHKKQSSTRVPVQDQHSKNLPSMEATSWLKTIKLSLLTKVAWNRGNVGLNSRKICLPMTSIWHGPNMASMNMFQLPITITSSFLCA